MKQHKMKTQRVESLQLSDRDWQAFNRQVRKELRMDRGKVHNNPQTFLRDLKRRY